MFSLSVIRTSLTIVGLGKPEEDHLCVQRFRVPDNRALWTSSASRAGFALPNVEIATGEDKRS
jgi:hypothetical protein